MPRLIPINTLPYEATVRRGGKLVIPASLAKAMNLAPGRYIITIEVDGKTIEFEAWVNRVDNARTMVMTVPYIVRARHNIQEGSVVRVVRIAPVVPGPTGMQQ